MIHIKWLISFFLILYWKQMQVRAFLNITLEALNTHHQLLKEVKIASIYKNEDEVRAKLNSTADIWLEFMEKYDKEEKDLFIDDVSSEVYSESMTLQFNLQDFQKHIQSVYSNLQSLLDYKNFGNKTMNYWYFTKVDYHSVKFTKENDYNLHTEDIWKDKLKKIHEILLEIDLETGLSVVDVISNATQAKNCKQQSRQQILFNMLRYITIADAKGFASLSYSYAIFKIHFDAINVTDSLNSHDLKYHTMLWTNKDMISKMKEAEREFIERNTNTIQKFKSHIVSVPRNVWNCDTMKDTSYTKMERVFQKYIINEVDLNQEGTCKKDCSFYSETKIYGCYNKNICARQRICNGTIRNCDDSFASAMNVYGSNRVESSRYKYIEVEGKIYGNLSKDGKFDSYFIELDSWPRGFYKCSYCMCICDNFEQDNHRYFNLRPVTSNIDLNYVVIGARFQKENGIIHIQIQEAQLLPNGLVNSSTVKWKAVDNYTINSEGVLAGNDYHTVTWNERTVLLDELDSPITDILTGLRFKLTDGSLKLEIRVTNFNFTTGRLIPQNSWWQSKNTLLKDRTELQLDSFKADLTPDVKLNHYLRFTTSSMEIDVGQNTIPFIDTTPVTSKPYVPLSGVGIFIKNDDKIGSFLSLKLLTYDLEQYIMKI